MLVWLLPLVDASASFVHPGVLLTRPMLERIRDRVATKLEPQFTAYQTILDPSRGSVPSIDNTAPQVSVGCTPNIAPFA